MDIGCLSPRNFRYPRACHLISLKVGGEQEGLEGGISAISPETSAPTGCGDSGEALTPSRGQGRAMHGQRMVEWLEVCGTDLPLPPHPTPGS